MFRFFKLGGESLARRWPVLASGLFTAAGIYLSVLLMLSCSGKRTVMAIAPTISGAEFVGSERCSVCHESVSRVFPESVHSRVHANPGASGLDTSCESCHGPGSRHVESGGGTTFERLIVNPGKSPEACFQCHIGVHAEFRLPFRHPVVEGHMSCVDCHDPHGHDIAKPAGGLRFSRLNESCAKCHREQTRHFVFEHEAMREGCTTCHRPHGSVNDKLLVQRDANLCLKCHAQVAGAPGQVVIGKVDHSFFLRQGHCDDSRCRSVVRLHFLARDVCLS